jgi:hypothetical protein
MFLRTLRHITLVLSLIMVIVAAPAAQAQSDQRCFSETGHCIAGRIRQYWEQNGGLPVFGFPITPQQEEQIEGRPVQVQWFQRNRLELHPENARPYDVLLGRLGADRLQQQSRDWFTFPKGGEQPGCRFFAETSHSICGDILQAWRASGLEFDGQRGKSEAENLALFGLPLSEAQEEDTPGGKFTVQWFERGRFELHPENQPPYNVLLGLLGSEVHGPAAPPSAPPPSGQLGIDGTWNGTTSQGKKITLAVSQNGLASFSIEFSDLGCGFEGTLGLSFEPPTPIKGNIFSHTSPGGGPISTSYTFSGAFRSNTAADGQLELTQSTSVPYVPCQKSATITWTAAKQ